MYIQKYKAKITDSNLEVIGYITETREYLGNGSYGKGIDFLITVTEISMPNGIYGTHKIDKNTIKKI